MRIHCGSPSEIIRAFRRFRTITDPLAIRIPRQDHRFIIIGKRCAAFLSVVIVRSPMSNPIEPRNTDQCDATASNRIGPTMTWLAALLVATTAISLAAAHAPARIRLIGLFSICFGFLIGGVACWLAIQCDAKLSRRFVVVVATGAALIGLIASTWETYRLESARIAKSGTDGIAARLIEEFDLRSPIVSSSRSTGVEFRRYLKRRIRQLGEWPSPWPECFWFAEVCAGATASGWLASRMKSGH